MADMKVAAYICQGCGLGERLDTDALVKMAQKDGKVPMAKEHDFLCNAEGVAMIRNDIDNEGVTHVMIAACSRRAKTEAFCFPDIAVSRANLREGVIWIRPDTDEARETTQEMAEDYVRMGCAEVKKMTAPGGNANTGTSKTLLVVGGGVTGMTAALEASKSRLSGGAGGENRRTRWLGCQAVQARAGARAVQVTRRHRRGRSDVAGAGRQQHQGLPQRHHSPRPTVRRVASTWISPPNPAPPTPKTSAPSCRRPASPCTT